MLTATSRRVSLVEHELLTIPNYTSVPEVFSGVRVVWSLVFCVVFCWSLFTTVSLFLLSIVLYIHPRITLLVTPLVSSTFSYIQFLRLDKFRFLEFILFSKYNLRHKYILLKYSPINMKTNIDVIYTCYNKKEKYSQACLKRHLYIANHCL